MSRVVMACATTRPFFSFHRPSQPSPPKPTTHFFISPKLPIITVSLHGKRDSKAFSNTHFTLRSIDVTKEDKPSLDQESDSLPAEETSEEMIDKRRLEEKFAVLNTGIYECRSCGYKYDESVGDPSYPVPPGFQFDKLPDDWRCPTCGAAQSFFESKMVEIAGFAQNQQFGLGGNALTSGQKTALIYGSLFFFFMLFLSGYFLQ